MKNILLCGICVFALLSFIRVASAQGSLYDLSATAIDGTTKQLSEYKGKVTLVVNVASQCGFTSQYAGLQKLYDTYKDKGFVILGFPCNDFGGQEPGTEADIQKFCSSKFGVSFPLFAKVTALGANKHAVYDLLTKSTGGGEVGWNFEKFLVGRNGLVLERFSSSTRPSDSRLTDAIEAALRQ